MRSAVIPLVLVNIAIFILQMVFPVATEPFVLHRFDVIHAPWTLITSMFMHGGVMHIFFNMYVLLMFGPLLEHRLGVKRFLALYFVSGIAASFLSQFIYPSALGASGAIMGLMGGIIMLMPDLKVLFFFFIPMPLWIAGIIIAAIDVLGVFGLGITGVANIAHLAGMGVGLGYGFYLKRRQRKFYRRFESKNHMDDDDIEEYINSGRI
jgi:uncharacterized protein